MVTIIHGRILICSKTHLDSTTHEQTIIIQQIVTLSKYGHDALDISNRYPAVYVASYVGRKSEVSDDIPRDFAG